MKLESDMPPKCFAKTFEDDNSKTVDYYSCATCNLKCKYTFLFFTYLVTGTKF